MSFNISEEEAWKAQYKKIWGEVEPQLLEKLVTEPIKKESRYVNGKLKTWKKRHKNKFSWSNCSIRHALQCNGCAKD